MPDLIPVEHDPFALNLLPVEYDPFVAPSGDGQFALGPTPKSGQTISVPDVLGEQRGIQGAVTSGLSNAFGLTDATRALRGEMTPEEAQNFALVGAAGIVAPEARGLGTVAEEAAPAVAKGIRAFHGSPYDFERFDMSKIGSGEGAQAYGHGLYFAEAPSVAENYRKALTTGDITYQGRKLRFYDEDPQSIAAQALSNNSGDYAKARQSLEGNRAFQRAPEWRERFSKALEVLPTIDFNDIQRAGHTYEVNIAADPEHFLDWDKPLSEQSEHGQQVAKPYIERELADIEDMPISRREKNDLRDRLQSGEVTGQEIYRLVARGDPGAAAQALRDAGIPGIKYLDQGSRFLPQQVEHLNNQVTQLQAMLAKTPKNDPQYSSIENALAGRRDELQRAKTGATYNYVVFDDKLIDIIKKYGIAGLIAGGAAHFRTMPVDHDPFAAQ